MPGAVGLMTKLTRQGVRDLDHLKGKPRGKVLEHPPQEAMQCPHKVTRIRYAAGMNWVYCDDCRCFVGEPW